VTVRDPLRALTRVEAGMKKLDVVAFGVFVGSGLLALGWPEAEGATPEVPLWAPGGADCDVAAEVSALALAPPADLPAALHDAARCGRVDGAAWTRFDTLTRLEVVRQGLAAAEASLAAGDPERALQGAEDVIRIGQAMRAGILVDATVGLLLEEEGWAVALEAAEHVPDPDAAVRRLLPLVGRGPSLAIALATECRGLREVLARITWYERLIYDPKAALDAFEAEVAALPSDATDREVLAVRPRQETSALRGIAYMMDEIVRQKGEISTSAGLGLARLAAE
jgi:hypothetical protein